MTLPASSVASSEVSTSVVSSSVGLLGRLVGGLGGGGLLAAGGLAVVIPGERPDDDADDHDDHREDRAAAADEQGDAAALALRRLPRRRLVAARVAGALPGAGGRAGVAGRGGLALLTVSLLAIPLLLAISLLLPVVRLLAIARLLAVPLLALAVAALPVLREGLTPLVLRRLRHVRAAPRRAAPPLSVAAGSVGTDPTPTGYGDATAPRVPVRSRNGHPGRDGAAGQPVKVLPWKVRPTARREAPDWSR